MKQMILQDERVMCLQELKPVFKAFAKGDWKTKYKHLFFCGDDNFICDYLYPSVKANNDAVSFFKTVCYVRTGDESAYREEMLQEVADVMEAKSFLETVGSDSVIYYFVDCIDGLPYAEKTLAFLEELFSRMVGQKRMRCVLSVLLPEIPVFSDTVTALSERELSYHLEQTCEKTPELSFYLKLEALCRRVVGDNGVDLTLLRFDNLYAPDRFHTPALPIQQAVLEAVEQKDVVITDADCAECATLTYIRSACRAVFYAAFKTKSGHVYQVADAVVSMREIKGAIYRSQEDRYSLTTNISNGRPSAFRAMSALKFQKTGIRSGVTLRAGVQHVVSYWGDEPFDTSDNIAFYNGKIKTIQALEVEILQEIDRICRANGINYFLAGGTLLGAVRSGVSIPWDDDLDIGMLRGDFEKFRKACKTQLSPKFSYSSPLNGSGSHYTIDKIRLDDSYFSTNFSSKNVYPDGIFVDILVYDQTSNRKIFQKLHGFLLTAITTLIYIKWYDTPRRKYHYWFSKLMRPIMRLIPWCVFHRTFEFVATLYKNKKNAKWLVDTVGKKVNDGPLPNEGLEQTVYVDFEGIKAPIPVDPVPYLNYAYGPNYMQQPVFSQRQCPHNFARIDLGKYVFDHQETAPFRRVDIRGELYESEDRVL